jgi:hypothetical protein
MILFSGGIDSTILAALSHIVLSGNENDLKIPFELINIASGPNPSSAPDRLASIHAYHELKKLPKSNQRDWRLIFIDITEDDILSKKKHITQLIYPKDTVMDFNIGTALWFGTRGIGRINNIDNDIDKIISILSLQPIPQLRTHKIKNIVHEKKQKREKKHNFEDLTNLIAREIIIQENPVNIDDPYYILVSSLGGEHLREEIEENNCRSLSELIDIAQIQGYVNTKKINNNNIITITKENDVIKTKEEIIKRKYALDKLSGKYNADNKYEAKSRIVIMGMLQFV